MWADTTLPIPVPIIKAPNKINLVPTPSCPMSIIFHCKKQSMPYHNKENTIPDIDITDPQITHF